METAGSGVKEKVAGKIRSKIDVSREVKRLKRSAAITEKRWQTASTGKQYNARLGLLAQVLELPSDHFFLSDISKYFCRC